jgi:microcystin degradation protein MlrC
MDPSSTCAQLWCTLKWRGMVLDNSGERRTGGVLIACAAEPGGATVDAILTDDRCSFTRPEIIESPGIRIGDYATVVVKQGYLFPLLRDLARRSILAFSPGTACQDLSRFTYTRLTRPLYPMDGDFSWAPSEKDII